MRKTNKKVLSKLVFADLVFTGHGGQVVLQAAVLPQRHLAGPAGITQVLTGRVQLTTQRQDLTVLGRAHVRATARTG